MDFDNVEKLRKSSRSYLEEPVSGPDTAALVKSACSGAVGMHNDKGYEVVVVQKQLGELKNAVEKAEKVKEPFYGAQLLFIICTTKEARAGLAGFDAGIIAGQLQLRAAALGLGSVILYGFLHKLPSSEISDILKKTLGLPGGLTPVLAVAVGHTEDASGPRKEDRHFEILYC